MWEVTVCLTNHPLRHGLMPHLHYFLPFPQLFLFDELELSLLLLVERPCLENLRYLFLSIFNDLNYSFFFRFEQLDSVVQAEHVELDFLSTLSNLRDRKLT